MLLEPVNLLFIPFDAFETMEQLLNPALKRKEVLYIVERVSDLRFGQWSSFPVSPCL